MLEEGSNQSSKGKTKSVTSDPSVFHLENSAIPRDYGVSRALRNFLSIVSAAHSSSCKSTLARKLEEKKFQESVDSNPTLASKFLDLSPSMRNLMAREGARPPASGKMKLDSDMRIRAVDEPPL